MGTAALGILLYNHSVFVIASWSDQDLQNSGTNPRPELNCHCRSIYLDKYVLFAPGAGQNVCVFLN